jgi:hypothetical protein
MIPRTPEWLDRYVLALRRRLEADGQELVELRTAEDVRRFFQRKEAK